MGDGDGMCISGGFSKSNWREDKKDMFFAFQIEMLYTVIDSCFNQEFCTFCYAMVDFPIAKG